VIEVKQLIYLGLSMQHTVNRQGTDADTSTIGVPDQRREGEGMTEFTMRRLNNEMIEQCAAAAEKAWPRAHTYASENADIYRGQDHAVSTVVKAIRSLKK
jgi:hypothetical protein